MTGLKEIQEQLQCKKFLIIFSITSEFVYISVLYCNSAVDTVMIKAIWVVAS